MKDVKKKGVELSSARSNPQTDNSQDQKVVRESARTAALANA